MYRQTPAYFRKFARNFRYYVSAEYPTLPEDNFAMAFHTEASGCSIADDSHWHILIHDYDYSYCRKKTDGRGLYTITCPYACFTELVLNGMSPMYSGNMFDKMKLALEYNLVYPQPDSLSKVLWKRLPQVDYYKNSSTQTVDEAIVVIPAANELSASPFVDSDTARFSMLIDGAYGYVLREVMETLLYGGGGFVHDVHSVRLSFTVGCTDAQCFCPECTELMFIDLFSDE